MSPAEVLEYVHALKGAGLMSCHLRIPVGETLAPLEMALTFAPPEPPVGMEVTPGGWRGPEKLDADFGTVAMDPPRELPLSDR